MIMNRLGRGTRSFYKSESLSEEDEDGVDLPDLLAGGEVESKEMNLGLFDDEEEEEDEGFSSSSSSSSTASRRCLSVSISC